jgi:hypothetical protein
MSEHLPHELEKLFAGPVLFHLVHPVMNPLNVVEIEALLGEAAHRQDVIQASVDPELKLFACIGTDPPLAVPEGFEFLPSGLTSETLFGDVPQVAGFASPKRLTGQDGETAASLALAFRFQDRSPFLSIRILFIATRRAAFLGTPGRQGFSAVVAEALAPVGIAAHPGGFGAFGAERSRVPVSRGGTDDAQPFLFPLIVGTLGIGHHSGPCRPAGSPFR